MSLVNGCIFEHNIWHCISRKNAHFHMKARKGGHYPLNQQVGCPIEVGLLTSMIIPLVGGSGDDGEWVVSPLGHWCFLGQSALALVDGNGPCLGIPLGV